MFWFIGYVVISLFAGAFIFGLIGKDEHLLGLAVFGGILWPVTALFVLLWKPVVKIVDLGYSLGQQND